MITVSKKTLQGALLSAIPKEYHPAVEAILVVERAYARPVSEVAFEVEFNVKRDPSQRRVSSFLTATNGITVEESQVSERFGQFLIDLGLATEKRTV